MARYFAKNCQKPAFGRFKRIYRAPPSPRTPQVPPGDPQSKRDHPHAKRTRGGQDTGRGPLGTPQVPPGDPQHTQCLRDPGPVETRPSTCKTDEGRPRYRPRTPQVPPGDPQHTQCLRDPGPVETRPPECETNHRRPTYGERGGSADPRGPPVCPVPT